MNKVEFLTALRERLANYPPDDIDERLAFYEEMIDDRIEDGMPEEEAVASIGSVDEIEKQVLSEIPLTKLVIKKVKPDKRLKGWNIALLVLGAPVWFPLCLALVIILLAGYIVFWSLALCVYAVIFALGACAVSSIPLAVMYFISGRPAPGAFVIGAGIALAGIFLLMLPAGAGVSKGILRLTKGILLWIKARFVRRED